MQEDSGEFYYTSSIMAMGDMVLTKALSWQDSQAFTNAYILSDYMSMLRKIEAGWGRREWLDLL
jgi:hypothetical protein